MADELVLTTTIADILVRVTKQEAKRAEEAMLLRTRLGHASTRATTDILTAGGILNCRTTSQDVRRVEELFRPSVAELRGKTKCMRSTPAGHEIRVPMPQVPQVIHADLFFVKSPAFLVAVLQPLGLTMCSYVKTRETDTLRVALQVMLAMAKSRGFGCVEMRDDARRGAVSARRHH